MRSRKSSALALCLIFLSIIASFRQVSAWTCESTRNVKLTRPMLDNLIWKIQNKIFDLVRTDPDGKQFYALVPGFVRLAFHSCSAKWCSSRIDLSELGNNGLQDAVEAADELHASIQSDPVYTGFSRADLHALCGVAALQVATDYKIRVRFRYGRPDFCPQDDPNALNQTLPSVTMGTDATYAFMKSVFGFSRKETATIMGAHALGAARNFLRPPVPIARWVNSPADSLTNEFYKALLDPRWHQIKRQAAGAPGPINMWVINRLPTKLMFNTDMGLMRHITTVNSTGASQCTKYLSCPFAPTAGTVIKYALSEGHFLKQFARVFTKMIENGLRGELLSVVA